MRKVNYETEQERQQLIADAESNGEVLKVDAILLNEKYLVFDVYTEPEPQVPTLEERIRALEDAQLASMGL